MSQITQEKLKNFVSYDTETGDFTWIIARPHRSIGSKAGCKTCYGYIAITIESTKYCAHRLAWLYTHGTHPIFEIDHINGNRTDNRIINLRDVTHKENMTNFRKAKKNNKSSGLLGSSWNARCSKWISQIRINGKIKHLGYFSAAEDAHQAYITEKRAMHIGCTI